MESEGDKERGVCSELKMIRWRRGNSLRGSMLRGNSCRIYSMTKRGREATEKGRGGSWQKALCFLRKHLLLPRIRYTGAYGNWRGPAFPAIVRLCWGCPGDSEVSWVWHLFFPLWEDNRNEKRCVWGGAVLVSRAMSGVTWVSVTLKAAERISSWDYAMDWVV